MDVINKINNTKYLLLIMFIGLIVRIIAYIFSSGFEGDTHTYVKAGEQFFSNGLIESHDVMPLYPIFTYIFGESIYIFNIIISSLTIYLVYILSITLFKNTYVGLVAAFVYSLYPHSILWSISSMTETTYVFLFLSSFILLYNQKYFLASIVIVLSILERPILDILGPFLLVIFSFYIHKESLKKTIANIIKYMMVYVCLMTPWWIHQLNKYEDTFVRLNLGTGLVLYAGNNPLNKTGGGVAIGGKSQDYSLDEFKDLKDDVVKRNTMKDKAIEYILENPFHFVKMAGKKFIRFWRLYPHAPQYEKIKYILLSLLSYGVVFIFFILYCFRYLKQHWKIILPILVTISYFTFVHMVFIASIRYRFPIEPFLIIFASFYFVERFELKKSLNVVK